MFSAFLGSKSTLEGGPVDWKVLQVDGEVCFKPFRTGAQYGIRECSLYMNPTKYISLFPILNPRP